MADGAQVIRLGEVKNKGQLVSILARMSQDPDVQEILPDRVFFPALVPNDSQFSQQWALSAANGVNAPGAWDIGTGSPTLVVAVLDTGRLPHDDLGIRWIGGYDFVSAVERGNDGDPRDGDSSDPGDWVTSSDSLSGPLAGCPVTDSRWHGTAMAGVIGAIANNGSGIAGLNWNSRLLPVRVIGKCGGYESDIADGLRWSVGLSVPGLPVNPNPARLVNMSLASTGLCTSALQAAVTDVTATGVAIIAAAGNNGASAIGFSPGNCAGVIAVGAVDKNGGKPAYSNFGTPVALSAPGGSGTAVNEAILTTFNQGLTSASANNDFVQTVTGTSVAAAHITGIASLMLSVNPDLTPEDLRDLIANSARAFPTSTTTVMPGPSQADCSIPLCGTGIANAQAAVQLAFEWRNVSAQIAAGRYYALGLRTDGKVFAWGLNSSGQLGDGTNTKRTTPVQTLFAGIRVMATGHASTLALRVDGTVLAVGENTFGQLGDGSTVNRSTPVQIPNFTKVASIAVGTTHAIASRTDGTVWTWGRNEAGQLGDGTTLSRASPGLVPGLATVTQVAAGNSRSFALKADGTVWAWGNNTFGALGNGNSVNQLTPVQVIGVSNIARIATHSTSGTTLAIRGDGTLWVIDDTTPAQFGTGTDYLRAAVGDSNFLAVRSAGEIWSWGNNYNGSLGRGTTINQTAPPAPVTSLNSTVGVSAAGCHSMALKADGTVWMWGYNNQGQLGNLNSNPLASAPLIITCSHALARSFEHQIARDFSAESGDSIGSKNVYTVMSVNLPSSS